MYTTFGRADIMVTSASATSAASVASMGSMASMVLVASVASVVLASTVTPYDYTAWHAVVMPFVMPLSLDRVARCDTPSYESSYGAAVSLY